MSLTTTQFALEVLRTYETRIAQDWIDGLLFMSTSGSRVKVCRELGERLAEFLQVSSPEVKYSGIHMEALLGDFGSGKSHLAFMLRHDLSLMKEPCLLLHIQMTGERRFTHLLSRLLRSVQITGTATARNGEIGISTFSSLATALHANVAGAHPHIEALIASLPGRLPPAFRKHAIQMLASISREPNASHVLSDFLDTWIARAETRAALDVFQSILGLFQIAGVAKRCIILLDEFESLASLHREAQLEFLQSLQDMHDDFAFRIPNLPPTFFVLFSTPQFWDQALGLLPSLISDSNRIRRRTVLGDITKSELYGLVDRYHTLHLLAGRTKATLDESSLLAIVDAVWKETRSRPGHMRSIHGAIRDSILRVPTIHAGGSNNLAN